MRLAIIGVGSIGSRHARNAKALGHEVCLYDADHRKAAPMAHELGLPGWSESFDVFDGDAVLICTPASTHAAVAKRVLDTCGAVALFCEKPLALSVDDCEVFRTWPHPTTQVGYMLRFHSAIRRMRAICPSPTGGGFYVDCDSREWPGSQYAEMMLELSHELDLALSFGAPACLNSSSKIAEHRATLWLGGAHMNWLVDLDDRCEHYLRHWMIGSSEDDGTLVRIHSRDEMGDEMYRDELAHFLDCAQRGVPTEVSFADGIRVLDVIAQAKEMAACQRSSQ